MQDVAAPSEISNEKHDVIKYRQPDNRRLKSMDSNGAIEYCAESDSILGEFITNIEKHYLSSAILNEKFEDLQRACLENGEDELAGQILKLASRVKSPSSWASRVQEQQITLASPADPSVQAAVMELRDQFWNREVPRQRPYPGRRSGVDPVEFVTENYGSYIRSGQLGPGQLQGFDRNLYMALRDELPRRAVQAIKGGRQDAPDTVAAFFEQMADESKRGSPFQRRVRACATILGTSETNAARFFGIRPERVKGEDRGPMSL